MRGLFVLIGIGLLWAHAPVVAEVVVERIPYVGPATAHERFSQGFWNGEFSKVGDDLASNVEVTTIIVEPKFPDGAKKVDKGISAALASLQTTRSMVGAPLHSRCDKIEPEGSSCAYDLLDPSLKLTVATKVSSGKICCVVVAIRSGH